MAITAKVHDTAPPQPVTAKPKAAHAPIQRKISPERAAPLAASNLAVQRLFHSGAMQAKLTISQPNDPDEQEADRIADQVIRMPEPSGETPCAACAAGGSPCPKCAGTPKIHRKAQSTDSISTSENPLQHLGPGQPLDRNTRSFFEPRFGTDFSQVRIHTGSQANEAARSIQAKAFTTGRDIMFGAKEYVPEANEGRRLLAHELIHTIQQGAVDRARSQINGVVRQDDIDIASTEQSISVQRQMTNTPPPTLTPPVDGASPPSPDAVMQLVEDERKAFDVAKGRSDQPAATALFSNPVSPSTKDSPVFETFKVGEVLDRQQGDPVRRGFDKQGPATAYAATMGTDVGGAVLQQDKFFFSAKLKEGKHKLRVADPSITELDWWTGRDHVYRVTAASGVVSVTGMGGFVFPLGENLIDDPGRAKFLKDPKMATPADAQSMRDIAGLPEIGPDGKAKPRVADLVVIPEDQQEAFILSYFRARGLEVLAANAKEADRLAEIFKATQPGTESKDPSGVSAEAKKIIDADRAQLKVYVDLLEQEVRVEAFLSFLRVCEERGEFPPFYPIYRKPQRPQVLRMLTTMLQRQADIQRRKVGLLAVAPLLGQIVGMPDPKDRFKPAERVRGNLVEDLTIPGIRGKGYQTVQESLLAKSSSSENDEEIRAKFLTRLDAIRKAIRSTRSEMFGDSDFLLEMDGLRMLVSQDLSSITSKNAGLSKKLADLLHSHAISEKTWKEAEFVIQIGLLFIPGIGPFLSATAGFAMAAGQMGTALRRWTAGQAAVNPAAALVDPRAAETRLSQATIELTINSVMLATDAVNALKTLESGAGAAKMDKALKELEEKETAESAKAATKGEGVRFQRTLKGRTIKYTDSGHLVICSSPCDFLFHRYNDVLDGGLRTRLTDIDTRLEAALTSGRLADAETIFEEALTLEGELHERFANLLRNTEGRVIGGGPAAHLLGEHGPGVTNKHLIDRVNVGAAGTATRFTDARKMEIAIADTLAANRSRISAWCAPPPPAGAPVAGANLQPPLRFNPGIGDLGIGYRWDPAAGRAVQITDPLETCVVILKSDGAGGYVIQTAFPEL